MCLVYVCCMMFFFDVIGLGLFIIIGVEIGMVVELYLLICVFFGILSVFFGGVIWDMLVNEVLLIFYKEIYVFLSLLGGIFYLFLEKIFFFIDWNYVIMSVLVVIVCVLVVCYKWVLLRFYCDIGEDY